MHSSPRFLSLLVGSARSQRLMRATTVSPSCRRWEVIPPSLFTSHLFTPLSHPHLSHPHLSHPHLSLPTSCLRLAVANLARPLIQRLPASKFPPPSIFTFTFTFLGPSRAVGHHRDSSQSWRAAHALPTTCFLLSSAHPPPMAQACANLASG